MSFLLKVIRFICVTAICFQFSHMNMADAKSTNKFTIGSRIKNPEKLNSLNMKRFDIYKKTIGVPREKAILNSQGIFENYYRRRGPSTITGKAFEARSAIRVNRALRNMGKGERVIITALEGFPNDASDLILMASDGRVVQRYQLKIGFQGTIDALLDPKYVDMAIVTPSDQLQAIKTELAKKKSPRGTLSPKWLAVDQSINNGRLTDQIAGQKVPTLKQVGASGKLFTHKMYEEELQKIALTPKDVSSEIASSDTVRKGHTKIAIKLSKYLGPTIVVATGVFDIVDGVHTLNEAERQMVLGQLDQDIYMGKSIVGVTKIGMGTTAVVGGTVVFLNATGITLLSTPEPFVTKIVAVVVIVTSVGLIAADYTLDRIQGTRTQSRLSLLKEIDEKTRQRIVIDQLQKMANNSNIPMM